MAGEAQQEQLTEQQKAVMKSLVKTGSEAPDMDFPERFIQDHAAMATQHLITAADRMAVLGVRTIETARHKYTDAGLKGMAADQKDLTYLDREKEESYDQKESKQEEAAIRRGEYNDYRTGMKATSDSAIDKYRKYKADPSQVKGVVQLDEGNDAIEAAFMRMPGLSEEDVSNRICSLMVYRDSVKDELLKLEAKKSKDPVNVLYLKHKKAFLACMEDAIRTWHAANGADENGSSLPQKAVAKAKKHLPLALEKFELNARKWKERYADELLDSGFVKKNEAYKKYVGDAKADEASRADEQGIVKGIYRGNSDEMESLEELIARNPEVYEKNKELVDRIFVYYSQRLRRLREIMEPGEMAQGFSDILLNPEKAKTAGKKTLRGRPGPADPRMDLLLTASMARINADHKLGYAITLEAEAARDLIRYILTGTKTDSLHAAVIEKEWGFGGTYKVDPRLPMAEADDELRGVEDAFEARKKELEEKQSRVSSEEAQSSDLKDEISMRQEELKSMSEEDFVQRREEIEGEISDFAEIGYMPLFYLPAVTEQLEQHDAFRKLNVIWKRQYLAVTGDNALEVNATQRKLLASPEGRFIWEAGAKNMPAYQRIVRSMTGIGKAPEAEYADMVRVMNSLAVVDTGKKYDGGREQDTDDAEKVSAMRYLMTSLLPQIEALKAHVTDHKVLEKRSMGSLFRNSDTLWEVEEKAMSLRDITRIMFDSPAYNQLSDDERKKLRDGFIFTAAVCSAAYELQSVQKTYCTRSVDELIAEPPSEQVLERASLEKKLELESHLLRSLHGYRPFRRGNGY